MQKRLKWLGHALRNLLPNNWRIRQRMIAAGLVLSLLSLIAPIYMRSHLDSLGQSYALTARNWDVLDRIQEIGRLVNDTEARIRAFGASQDPRWVQPIAQNRKKMNELIGDLGASVLGLPRGKALLTEATENYKRWLDGAVDPVFRRPSRKLNEQMLSREPEALRALQLLNQLTSEIRENTIVANNAVSEKTRKATLVVTWVGLFFFFSFTTFLVSLWYTIMPGITSLLTGAKELKRGNLDHRVHIAGRTETAQLGRAFNEMAVSLKAQNEKLKELNQLKTDFVSTVSHELRTPLTAIKGSIGLILGEVTGPIPAETAEMLKITQKNTDRLIRLINEILDIAKIEAGAIQMHFDKYGLAETLSHAILGIEAFAQTQGIKLVWEKPQMSPLVVIDRDRIEQVVTNLLSNAIKFTEPGGTVTVRCEWEEDRVVVEVQDTGEGIPEEFLERIFQKFHQVGSAANHGKEGTGLGLTIAKAIIEEHGGTIWVNSKVNQGSIFGFSLPWNGIEFVEQKRPQKPVPGTLRQKTILLVDNEQDFTTVFSKFLEHEGYEVIIAQNGQEGIELAREHQPDLILLDVMMPGLDGFETQSLLKQTRGTSAIPVALITTSSDAQHESRASGAVAVFTKPLAQDMFKDWLRVFLSSRKRAA